MAMRVVVTGASGRMGTAILKCLLGDPETAIAGACDLRGAVGKDIGALLGEVSMGLSVQDSLEKAIAGGKVDGIIDFSAPQASIRFAEIAAKAKIPLVIGTTGFSDDEKREIADAARDIPIVLSPNMSVGVNALFRLIEDAVKILGEGYDLEVVEAHHRLKKDAPSGTAVKIGEILAQASGRAYPKDARFHREGLIGERMAREIGMQTIRGGDIVGEHTVMYCGLGERLEIKHIATSRDTFARGAIRAAKWLQGRSANIYGMGDVLGIGTC